MKRMLLVLVGLVMTMALLGGCTNPLSKWDGEDPATTDEGTTVGTDFDLEDPNGGALQDVPEYVDPNLEGDLAPAGSVDPTQATTPPPAQETLGAPADGDEPLYTTVGSFMYALDPNTLEPTGKALDPATKQPADPERLKQEGVSEYYSAGPSGSAAPAAPKKEIPKAEQLPNTGIFTEDD